MHKAMLRNCLMLPLTLVLASCMSPPNPNAQRPILPPPPKGAQIAGTQPLDCDGQGYNSGVPGRIKCHQGIPVLIVLGTDQQGQPACFAKLDYSTLTVHTGQLRTKVMWEIKEQGYEFATHDQNGVPIDGIWIRRKPSHTDPTQPDAIYDRPGFDGGNKRKYKMEVMPGAPSGKEFDHGANVVGPGNRPCYPLDPPIVNQDN